MNQISREIETSLKPLYGDRWREGLVVFLLIGLGRSKMKRTPIPISIYQIQMLDTGKPADEVGDTIKKLLENPFGYLRLINEKAARKLETQLGNIPRTALESESKCAFTEFGVLLEVIGIGALSELSGYTDNDLTDLFEDMVQESWEKAPSTTQKEIEMIIRTLSFFSASV
jgi:hypothetical protein